MAIAITEAHRELAGVARSFLDGNKARAARARPARGARRDAPTVLGRHGRARLARRAPARGARRRRVRPPRARRAARGARPGDGTRSLPAHRHRVGDRRPGRERRAARPPPPRPRRRHAHGRGRLVARRHARRGHARRRRRARCSGPRLADLLLVVAGDDVVDRRAPRRWRRRELSRGARSDPSGRAGALLEHPGRRRPGAPRRGGDRARELAWLLTAAEAAGGAHDCVDAVGRVREGPRPVRPSDRHLPGREAPLREHARRGRARHRRGVGRRPCRRRRRPTSSRSRAPPPPRSRSPPSTRTRSCTSRCTAASASRGSTTDTSCCARATTLAALVDARDAATAIAAHAVAGVTREADFTLPPEAERYRDEVRAAATELAALEGDAQLARMIDTGYVQPHWPKPWGRESPALEQLVIDAEFAAAGVRRPEYGITGWIILTLAPARRPRPDRAVGATHAGAASSCGASCSASPTPAPTPPASAPVPCASTAGGRSPARRCGRATPSTASAAWRRCAPIPTPRSTPASPPW